MYIELVHDAKGKILACYCSDVAMKDSGVSFFTLSKMPEGAEQVKISIDTLTAMEIDQNSGSYAVMEGGKPVVKDIDRAGYIRENFVVGGELPIPDHIKLPPGMKMKTLKRSGN